MKKFQKTFGKVSGDRQVYVMTVGSDGYFGIDLRDIDRDGSVHSYGGNFWGFRSAAQWAYNMANNHDIGCRVNHWMCDKTGLNVWND